MSLAGCGNGDRVVRSTKYPVWIITYARYARTGCLFGLNGEEDHITPCTPTHTHTHTHGHGKGTEYRKAIFGANVVVIPPAHRACRPSDGRPSANLFFKENQKSIVAPFSPCFLAVPGRLSGAGSMHRCSPGPELHAHRRYTMLGCREGRDAKLRPRARDTHTCTDSSSSCCKCISGCMPDRCGKWK